VHPYRKLLVLAVNHLIDEGLIDLNAQQDVKGHTQTTIAGRNTAINWTGIGCGEIRIAVWWDYDHSKHPQANLQGNFRESFQTGSPLAKRQHFPKFVGVVVSCWLEREKGKYLQGREGDFLPDRYARRGALAELEALPDPIPNGYAAEGRKHL
jgi:hypothetical protein